mmetsp:Transcript_23753/g.26471  ORF Transcript_23753/g.26471 Transcript_23753/m.26471 type:complete len:830 (-) Transcript_23753:86-2575(-)
MPSLKLFGQRTFMAGDDLRGFLVLNALFRTMQLALACSLIGITIRDNNSVDYVKKEINHHCSEKGDTEDNFMYIYSMFSIVISTISLCLVGPMFYYSGIGTPTDQKLRKPLTKLCYFDITCMNLFRCIVFGISFKGLKLMIKHCQCISGDVSVDTLAETRDSCIKLVSNVSYISVYLALGLTYIFDFVMTVLMLLYFTCCHKKIFMNSQIEFVSSERRCSICLRCCIGWASIFTCCLFGGDKAVRGDYANFSLLLANYVNGKGILDVTPSDISVGLHMLRIIRKRNKLETTNRLVQEHGKTSKQKLISRQGSSEKISTNNDKNKIEAGISSDGNSVDFVHDNHNTVYCRDFSMISGEKDYNNTEFHNQDEHSSSLFLSKTSLEETKEENYYNHARIQNPSEHEQKRETLSNVNSKDVNLINEAAHFMLYAQAAYTVVAYMLEYPVTGLGSLLFQMLRNWIICNFPYKKESIEGDSVLQLQTIAFKSISGLADKDIIHANFIDTITEIPYMILLDHDWKSVVVTIRGTITLESVLTDMNVAPEELLRLGEECGFDGKDFYCHTGMLASTEWIYRDIQKIGKLTKILAEYEGYKLRIIGHSLGAGVAAILSVLLRPKYPNIRCLAFSPPGCVMSENLADDVASFTTAYVVNDDIVARTSIEGFEELRDSILEMIYRIKIPKHMVTKVSKYYDNTTVDGLSKAINHILHDKDDTKDSKFKHKIEEFQKHQKELKEKNRENYIKLCPPGDIIQLFQTAATGHSEYLSTNVKEMGQYTARWANRIDFEKIHISSHLLSDHNSTGVKIKLEQLAREKFGLRLPFLPKSELDVECK